MEMKLRKPPSVPLTTEHALRKLFHTKENGEGFKI